MIGEARETRQQVRAEGRELDKSMRRRERREAREERAGKLPWKGRSGERAKLAARRSQGWLKRHENPGVVRRERAEDAAVG